MRTEPLFIPARAAGSRRLEDLDAEIVGCALDAMLVDSGIPLTAPATGSEPNGDAIPVVDDAYEDVEIERRTWAYRGQ